MSTQPSETTATLDNPARRLLLKGSAGVLAAYGLMHLVPTSRADTLETLPDYVSWKRQQDLILHGSETIETRRDAIRSGVITPSRTLFVRNNLPAPDPAITEDPDAWEISIEGVGNPRTLSLGELKRMQVTSVASVLQCSGNGRAFFPHGASGTQWSVGAAGCVVWTGVPLKAVIDELGGSADGARYITATGGETIPEGLEPKDIMVERSIPTEALESALLAWEMNDEPLDRAHGGPLRLVVPGYYGVNNVKYVRQLAMTEEQTDAKIQVSGYRVRDVGVSGSSDQPSMWEMNVKSWVTLPLDTTHEGRNLIYGVAFGGTKAIDKVEVSVDGGESWQEAEIIGPDLGPYAWRPFVLATELSSGEHRIVSRATDMDGNSQPRERTDNERGYGHNGWEDHGVSVNVG
ncbi:sulfite oxidase [Halomonas urumqiensis]|uniref:Sulfite oxidase n=1 Tax=Halomonas urumqiensis TaxID=1684789 RepID=A0A2N7UPT0_9GAMM|nr:sulfite oxidase [Halomonas urumqiensis]PMR82412.1 sulfite oxidase [Halomonas urumqiensis]PTB04108.1 sulfite oxidase [Halomonas urumqiensis]GHE19625.1 sulfite oxidase [Halomonas urumqiensis]